MGDEQRPDLTGRPTDGTQEAGQEAGPAKRHGDPLLAAAQGRGDGDEGTRHGADRDGQERSGGAEPGAEGADEGPRSGG